MSINIDTNIRMNSLDNLMQNHELATEEVSSIPSEEHQTGGGKKKLKRQNELYSNKPNGGFPPIYVMTETEIVKQQDTKNRQFATIKSAISIKDILGKTLTKSQS